MRKVGAGALVVALLTMVIAVVGGSPAVAKGKHGPVVWGAASCSYSGRSLTQIRVAPPKASMDKSLARQGGRSQYVGLRVQLQGLKAGRWVKVANRPKKHDYSVTVKVHPRKKTSLKHAKLLTFKGSALPASYSSFRIRTTVQWYAYNGHTIRGQLHRTSGACVRTKPAPPPHVVQIRAGSGYACALMSNASLRCWGYNGNGRVGDGTGTTRLRPVTPRGMASGVRSYSVAVGTTCALQSYVVRCWGRNDKGSIGDGTTVAKSTPVVVKNLSTAYNVFSSGGSLAVCATSGNQPLKCWGAGTTGELGNKGTANALTPVPVTGVGGVTTAATGNGFACAASPSTTWCWGSNYYGALGTKATGSSTAYGPTKFTSASGVSGVSSIAAGSLHACAIVTNAGLKCWGSNASGQIGAGTAATYTPVTPAGGFTSGVTSVSADNATTCAVKRGAVYCWGDNQYGQLGVGHTGDYSTPQRVGTISNAVGVAVGSSAAYAWDAAGHVWSWGDNQYGQLATGNTTSHLAPVAVSIH